MNASPNIDHSLCAGHALVQHLDNPDFGLRPALHVQLRWMTGDVFKQLARIGHANMVAALRLESATMKGLAGLFGWPSEHGDMLDLLAIGVPPRKELLEWLGKGFKVANELLWALDQEKLSEGIGVCLHGEARPVVEEVRKQAQRVRVNTEALYPGWAAFPEPDWEVTPRPRTSNAARTGRS